MNSTFPYSKRLSKPPCGGAIFRPYVHESPSGKKLVLAHRNEANTLCGRETDPHPQPTTWHKDLQVLFAAPARALHPGSTMVPRVPLGLTPSERRWRLGLFASWVLLLCSADSTPTPFTADPGFPNGDLPTLHVCILGLERFPCDSSTGNSARVERRIEATSDSRQAPDPRQAVTVFTQRYDEGVNYRIITQPWHAVLRLHNLGHHVGYTVAFYMPRNAQGGIRHTHHAYTPWLRNRLAENQSRWPTNGHNSSRGHTTEGDIKIRVTCEECLPDGYFLISTCIKVHRVSEAVLRQCCILLHL